MAHSVEFVEDNEYLRVTLTDELTNDALVSAREDTIPALESNRCSRVLVDASSGKPQFNITEHFKFTSELASVFPRGVRIALLVRAEDLENHQFAETVAVNRGLSMYAFCHRKEAVEWLLGVSSPSAE